MLNKFVCVRHPLRNPNLMLRNSCHREKKGSLLAQYPGRLNKVTTKPQSINGKGEQKITIEMEKDSQEKNQLKKVTEHWKKLTKQKNKRDEGLVITGSWSEQQSALEAKRGGLK